MVECVVTGMVAAMVVIARPFRFDDDDPRAMLRHLDGWSRRVLVSAESWGSVLERCGQWADYSARNQVLLASYGVVGPVAGSATWAQVPSVEPGRSCAVRAGEHGLPIRVPVVDMAGVTSERSRAGARSGSVAGGLRWEPVYALEQLARRPTAGALAPVAVPVMSARERVEAVRVASGRVLGRTPRKIGDPAEQLAVLAGRVPHGSGRVRLSGVLADQAGWLVADRLGWEPGPMPAFDPVVLSARERWRTVVDLRHAVGQVLAGVSHAVGVDLSASMLPRHDLVDDRTVVPGRRNYLAPADVRGLPLGVWVEAGPYTRAEWLARGVVGAVGVAGFLRVNDRSYLAAYETRTGAMWRLETSGRGAHHGLVADGDADTLSMAKDGARAALQERFPEAARAVEVDATAPVVAPEHGWVAVPGGRDDRSRRRVFDERVAAMISPGPGGRWQTWVTVDGGPRQGPLAAGPDDAQVTAEALARGALMELATYTPDRANALVHDMATSGSWDRAGLVDIVGHRLTDTDRSELASTHDPQRLVELVHSTGVIAPTTMLQVLHAEAISAATATGLVPALGLPTADAVRMLHTEWGADRLDVGAALGATVEELRAAGCTTVEMLAVAPREELRRLDSREQTWALAAPTLIEAGYTRAEAVAHLAAHAPTPATFAAGVTAIIDEPLTAVTLAAARASSDDLAALTERFGLSPAETAAVLANASVPTDRAIAVLGLRCDGADEVVSELAASYLGVAVDDVTITDGRAPIVPLHPELSLDRDDDVVGVGVDL